MIGLTILAIAAAASPLDEAARALAAGRSHQARAMVTLAIAQGARGERVDRLLADLAFASGDWSRALASYEQLLLANPGNAQLTERAGIAAFRAGDLPGAEALLSRSTTSSKASWRAWNALGAIADLKGDWQAAGRAYAEALTLRPNCAEVLNNVGWSRLLQGDWQGAATSLEQAHQFAPAEARIAANLDLARSFLSEGLPERRPGESKSAWAGRLNDAGVIAARQGDKAKAVAAFARALEASDSWYYRAANNLVMAEAAR